MAELLVARGPEAAMSMSENEYEEVEFGVDSGASDTVVGPEMFATIKTGGVAFIFAQTLVVTN